LVRPAPRAFFRPDRQSAQPPRAGPVKAGRVFAATRRAWPWLARARRQAGSDRGWRLPESALGRGLVVIPELAPATNPSQHVCTRVPAAGVLTGQW